MFEAQFDGIDQNVTLALQKRLETVVLMIAKRYNAAMKGTGVKNYTSEELSGMVASIFEIAESLQPFDAPKDE